MSDSAGLPCRRSAHLSETRLHQDSELGVQGQDAPRCQVGLTELGGLAEKREDPGNVIPSFTHTEGHHVGKGWNELPLLIAQAPLLTLGRGLMQCLPGARYLSKNTH